MRISSLSERVTFEKNSVTIDDYGNHINSWEEYFSCAAYVAASSYKSKESEQAGVVASDDGLELSVRYCSELSGLDSTHYRVFFRGERYNITSVDMMGYGREGIKVSCEKERGQSDG